MKYIKCIRQLCYLGFTLLILKDQADAQTWNPNHSVGTVNGVYNFSWNQTPAQLVEIYPATISGSTSGLNYQWEQSAMPTTGFTPISSAIQSTYIFPGTLQTTTYYRRKTINSDGQFIYSNIIKIDIVSITWEDINYIREHDVITTGVTSWTAIDQLVIGSKLQTTTYLDGLGRGIEKVCRETATPSNPNNLWGDMVQFAKYDGYGRQAINYLPYTTTTQSGKYKTTVLTEQPQYYLNTYNENSAFSTITFDNSPLHRIINIKEPGTVWAASVGTSGLYELNTLAENIQNYTVDYVQGHLPVNRGTYPANSLYKITSIDVNGKNVIQYIDNLGKLILKKVQLDDVPSVAYTGWICTYFIYDDFGQLRYEIQPEGVKYLDNNNWSFAGTTGQLILNEQCFQYNYDEKGLVVWKKAPGALPLNMLYDIRDRIVFGQDGNQASLSVPQWTASLYDELDRPIISTLYNTTKTIAQLKSDISNAALNTTITVANAGTVSVTAKTHLNPISSASLNNASVTTILVYQFYDNYSFNAVKTFNTNYNNLNAYSTIDPNVQTIDKTFRTTSLPTGSMTRVLGSTTFLSATHYYDERGLQSQTLEDNIKSGTDITTIQYHFDGRIMSTCNDHTVPNTGYTNFKTLTKYIFDKLGRVTSIQKQFGSNAFKTITAYDYDDAGRLKVKHLDPGYTTGVSSPFFRAILN